MRVISQSSRNLLIDSICKLWDSVVGISSIVASMNPINLFLGSDRFGASSFWLLVIWFGSVLFRARPLRLSVVVQVCDLLRALPANNIHLVEIVHIPYSQSSRFSGILLSSLWPFLNPNSVFCVSVLNSDSGSHEVLCDDSYHQVTS